MEKIVFIGYTHDSCDVIEPLFRALTLHGIQSYFIPGYTGPIDPDRLNDAIVVHSPQSARRKVRSNKRNALRVASTVFTNDGLKLFNVSLNIFPTLCELPQLASLWTRHYPNFLMQTLQNLNPDLVVLPVAEVCAQIAARCCEKLQIRYCYLLTHHHEIRNNEPFEIKNNSAPYLVSGKHGKERLLDKGISEHLIAMTGNPRFDKCFSAKGQHREINSGKKNILLTLNEDVRSHVLLTYLSKFIHSNPDVQLTTRFHPKLSEKSIHHIKIHAGELHQNIVFQDSNTVTIEEALHEADLLITGMSSTLLEAMILEVPTLYWHTSFMPPEFPFTNEKSISLVTSTYALYEKLQLFLSLESKSNNANQSNYQRYFEYPAATEKVIQSFKHIGQEIAFQLNHNSSPATNRIQDKMTSSFSSIETIICTDSPDISLQTNNNTLIVTFCSNAYESLRSKFNNITHIAEFGQKFENYDQLYDSYRLKIHGLIRTIPRSSRQQLLSLLVTNGALFHFTPILYIQELVSGMINQIHPKSILLVIKDPSLKSVLMYNVKECGFPL